MIRNLDYRAPGLFEDRKFPKRSVLFELGSVGVGQLSRCGNYQASCQLGVHILLLSPVRCSLPPFLREGKGHTGKMYRQAAASWRGEKALTQERESSPLPSIMFAGRPFPRGRTRNGRLTGKLFAKREDPFVAHQFVRGAPIPSQAYEDWETNGEGVHRRKGKPSPCAPICSRGAHSLPGIRRLGG